MGDLGSGKTTFVQGLARGLGIKERILSPTFILMRQYDIKTKNQNKNASFGRAKLKNLYHIDLYRLVGNIEQEYRSLGLEEIVGEKENIVVIEWAEKVRGLLPADTIWIRFGIVGEDGRKIIIKR